MSVREQPSGETESLINRLSALQTSLEVIEWHKVPLIDQQTIAAFDARLNEAIDQLERER